MSNYLEYKGYYTDVKIDFESKQFYGELEGIRDFVNFESETIDGIVREFHSAVDDYLAFCERHGKMPNVPESLPIAAYA